MTSPHLKSAMDFMLRWEGGFVDDPDDPGGRTNKGVTQAVYDAYRRDKGKDPADVLHISEDEVHDIYEERYWKRAKCDRLRHALDLVTFDTAVNMGTGRAVRILQEAVGTAVDGGFGPNTQAACDACDLLVAVPKFCDIRERVYHAIVERRPTSRKFLRGWMNRLNDLRAEAGVPGFSRKRGPTDFGDTSFIAKVPDLGPGEALER